MSQDLFLVKEIKEKISKEFSDTLKIYKEYQILKNQTVRPLKRYSLDPQKIVDDLRSEEFFQFIEGLKERT